ncbi:2OG-Fe dioxygenase family protein [Solimonas soli]|uniref:2OG-Fe dioxygenase family protein n=1 Tax=Solimonas soli TaxID=413479 RepID=UPI00047F5F4D|nr:2OG-Fe dioxygenase family protein [Solimonas soli]
MAASSSRSPEPASLDALAACGHRFVPAAALRAQLAADGGLADWAAFVDSWNGMPLDTYMADGGRYRRRRHGVYAVDGDGIARQPPQAHWQSRDYNALNGGIARWFEPIAPAIADGATMTTLLRFCATTFAALAPDVARWHVEVHQFRIEASAGEHGRPTPEGVHRDGVDYVLVLMVKRRNIASGTTTIHAPDGTDLGAFTLIEPCDAMLLDDKRVFHGVTPVEPVDPLQPAYRDVLVVTFRRDRIKARPARSA